MNRFITIICILLVLLTTGFTQGGLPKFSLGDHIESLIWILELGGILLLAFMKWRSDNDKLDLEKTLEAAVDAAKAVNDHLETMPGELREKLQRGAGPGTTSRIVDHGVAYVEEIRGKRLKPKLLRKARARIKNLVNIPIPLPGMPVPPKDE